MNRNIKTNLLLLAMLGSFTASAQNGGGTEFKGKIGKTVEESVEWWPAKKKAPANAPNVIVLLIDDAGYGTSSAFGGLMQTPMLDSLANKGLRYTNFHTTGVCSPTRAALLTGRNHHSVHMGHLNYASLGYPGYDAVMPADKATVTEILKENNYNNYIVGKYHVAPVNEITSVGPFDRWPLGRGFDHFYGWHLGHTDQYYPNLYDDNQVAVPDNSGKHVTTLLADKAIKYIANQKSIAPENPFFLYFSVGAIHSPHQVDKKWSDLYKGKFDKGWDWYREEVFARQKKLGILPANAVLPDRDPTVAPWESLSPEAKKVYARYMEIYAGFMTHTDYEFSRVIHYLQETGHFGNTLVIAIIGDNGSSHGPKHGALNGYVSRQDDDKQVAEAAKNLSKFGTEHSFMDAPAGWTQATNTPFRLWKTDANAEGGTRNPLIVYYPEKIKEQGGIRNQYGHVTDITPTILDFAGANVPETIKGVKQQPFEGTSLVYSANDAAAPDRHTVQYYELRGKRAIYKDGWKASVFHEAGTKFEDDVWELYDLKNDFNERIDVAKQHPQKLKELQALFDAEAQKYNVYPLVDATQGRGAAGRQRSAFTADRIVLYPGVDQLLTMSGPQFQGESFSITAEVNIRSAQDEGVLFATGSEFEGLSLFVKDGKFQVAHNTGSIVKHLESPANLAPGKHQLRFELHYTGKGGPVGHGVKPPQKPDVDGGTEAIYIDGVKVGERTIKESEARYIGFYKDAIDVGQDLNSPVTGRYQTPFKFTGDLKNVTIEYK
ncbi:arylsulfatase [Chitinophaga sp. GCM10012297]|uniref:Sulfatase-like hydrolase/transferase n=1 Tax=Chitinophaga chungangae TaxID=2821488 RepID=A0ABS3Y835_9BACT|nr:arylsulfatase [Chitinophaga chungangae]MBO9150837.1 sulfatase-like hydrolase/transferase [Chitinophaga chungangae]